MTKKYTIFATVFLSATVAYGSVNVEDVQQKMDQHAFRSDEIECLTRNIYHEARGEETVGQIAVAYVTVNRRDHDYFPDTICDVVKQGVQDRAGNMIRYQCQFSWYCDGRSDRMRDEEARDIAYNIAEWVYDGKEEDPTNGALFYHAEWVNPDWASKVDEEAQIGIHVFYTWNGKW